MAGNSRRPLPFVQPVDHPVHGRFDEFPAFSTTPQQDHRSDGKGINILTVTDRRAQPWRQIIQANCHFSPVSVAQLPPKTADKYQVREFIYLVLTNIEKSYLAYQHPHAICATLQKWRWDGRELRLIPHISQQMLNEMCPASYMTVYGRVHYLSTSIRVQVGCQLRDFLLPLLLAEEMLEKEVGKAMVSIGQDSDDEATLNGEDEQVRVEVRHKNLVRRNLAKVFRCMRQYEYVNEKCWNEKIGF